MPRFIIFPLNRVSVFRLVRTSRAEVVGVTRLTPGGGVDAIFFVYLLSLFFLSPLVLNGGQRRRGERAGEKQGEGHVAAHRPGKPLPPALNSLCVFLGGWQRTSALRAVPWFQLCTLA